VTAVLSNTDDLWAVTAAAVAAMPSRKQARAAASQGAIVPPGGAAAGKADARAEAAVERFRKGLSDPAAWGDDLGRHGDAIAIGPVAGQVARGPQAIERLWQARIKAHVREATSGEVTSAITADGELVWLSVPVTRVSDDDEAMPLRVFAIYAKAGAGWSLVALHEALALDEPGAGAPFLKILPPAPKVAPPEPAKAAPPEAPAKPPAKAKKKPRG
jgi:ketosteroid isomerase-like protein